MKIRVKVRKLYNNKFTWCFHKAKLVSYLSFLYVCMVNTIYLLSFVDTPRKFIIAELSIRKLGSSSVLIILALMKIRAYGSNLRGVSTKLNKYSIVFAMKTYKEPIAYVSSRRNVTFDFRCDIFKQRL